MSDQRLTPAMRRTVLASFAGSTFEWFDFGLYVTTAAIVFNTVFFPHETAALGTLFALLTSAVGYLTRPIGGLIFGHFGDRVGRKRLLLLTMLIMGIPTVLIGFLPSYATIGVAAPVILLVLRLLQGFGLGGEYAGAALAAIESAPQTRRGVVASIPQTGNPFGGLLGSLIVLIVTSSMSSATYEMWGWRIPFFLSLLLLGYGLYLRSRLTETRDFVELQQEDSVAKVPLFTVVRHHWRSLLLGLGARLGDITAGVSAGTVATSYVVVFLHQPRPVALVGTVVASALGIPFMIFMGFLSDRSARKGLSRGRRRVYLSGLALIGIGIFPMFLGISTKIALVIWLSIILFTLCDYTQFSVQSAFLADIFPTEVRYTGISIVYQVSSIAGGFLPPIAVAMMTASGGEPWTYASLVAAIAAVSLTCAIFMKPHLKVAEGINPVMPGAVGAQQS